MNNTEYKRNKITGTDLANCTGIPNVFRFYVY